MDLTETRNMVMIGVLIVHFVLCIFTAVAVMISIHIFAIVLAGVQTVKLISRQAPPDREAQEADPQAVAES